FSSRRRHTRLQGDWSSDVCSSDLFEPKWDGFRCLAFRDGETVDLRSKSGQPFNRYFPELVSALQALDASRFVLDGELVVPVGDRSEERRVGKGWRWGWRTGQ